MRRVTKVLVGSLIATMAWGSGWSMSSPYGMTGQTVHAAGDKHIFAGAGNSFVVTDNRAFGSGVPGAMGYPNPPEGLMVVPTELNLSDRVVNPAVRKISAGAGQTVVLDDDGNVWAIGRQGRDEVYRGAFGDNEVIHTDWTPVYGLTNIVEIATGTDHSLAVKADGTVYAWGYNLTGQLGVPVDTVTTAIPVQVPGLTNVKSVSAGDGYSLALKTDGTVWSFGSNQRGELGVGTTFESTYTPQQVYGLFNVASIDAGSHHALAVLQDGTVWGWGYTMSGQVNDRNAAYEPYRTQPQKNQLDQVTAVSAGETFSLALKQDGTVWAFGSNLYGELGQGGPTANNLHNPTPLQIPQLSQVTEIAAGDRFALAKRADNSVYGWGENMGQLGIGPVSDPYVTAPVRMKEPLKLRVGYKSASQNSSEYMVQYSLYDYQNPALNPPARFVVKRAGVEESVCNGSETTCTVSIPSNARVGVFEVSAYDLQDGTLIGSRQIRITNGASRSMVAVGDYHSMWRQANGTLYGYGLNSNGQLGDGTFDMRLSPVSTLFGVTNVTAGSRSTLVSKSDGTIWAFGGNSNGELGIGNTIDQTLPVQVSRVGGAPLIDMGSHHAMAGVLEGQLGEEEVVLYSWGLNTYGQLGNGDKANRSVPEPFIGWDSVLFGSTLTSTGFGHTLFVAGDGKVYAVGRNDYGQLGNRTTTDSTTPVEVPYLSNVVAISAGPLHSAALTRDGSIYTWGYNASGQLGDGTFEHSSVPVKAKTGAFNVAMDSGRGHMISTASDGSVWTWGYNFKGQLGNGTRTDSAYPAKVPGLTVADISAGGERSAVIQEDGSVYMFGSNSYGELGDGTRTYSTTPVITGDLLGLSLYVSDSTTSSLTISTSTLTPVAKRVVKRNGVVICQGTCANFVDSGLTAFTPYTYTVEAYDAVGKLLASKTQVEATQASNGLEGFEQEYFQEDFYPLQ
ncbi:hypothetical protein OS242_10775 [Tumebacillus sp. DT12]|uniref:RCC1-like domain-containing protein n=1 Tax=Tumebacillus lacus TaxID=2995335 RepID=A0ABT3X4D1_9BACL|nr:hypothetical protein [Tumebacillus lacus]MCX7570445.1 hypothetical protein [Tumebacillus lacus]